MLMRTRRLPQRSSLVPILVETTGEGHLVAVHAVGKYRAPDGIVWWSWKCGHCKVDNPAMPTEHRADTELFDHLVLEHGLSADATPWWVRPALEPSSSGAGVRTDE